MPSLKDLLVAASRSGPGVTLLSLAGRAAFADHGIPAPARAGFGWMSWLLVVGAVVAVGLAAWAFFAPDHEDGSSKPTPGGTRREPPPR